MLGDAITPKKLILGVFSAQSNSLEFQVWQTPSTGFFAINTSFLGSPVRAGIVRF